MSTEPEPSVVWEIESTSPDKGIKLRQALREVVDPELGLSVVELGLIRQAAIKDDGVHLTMIMTTPFCPYGPPRPRQPPRCPPRLKWACKCGIRA
jgi:hypothetical protein